MSDECQVGNLDSQLFSEVVSLSSQAILIVEAGKSEIGIVYANAAYEEASGYDSDELTGSSWLSYAAADEEVPELVSLKSSLACNEAATLTLPFLRKDGEIWVGRLKLQPLPSGKKGRRLFLVEHELDAQSTPDGTELFKRALGLARERLASLDRTDPMTGLMSKSQFMLLLRREIAVARREHQPLHLILFSIPELDTYRDTFGNNAADSCLRMIGAQVAGTFRRATDLNGRIDQTTFAVAFRSQDNALAEKLVALVEKKSRNLGLHNPRGRRERYVFVQGACVVSESGAEGAEALMNRCREMLADAAQSTEMPVAELA